MERNYDLEKRKYVIGGAVIVIVLIFLIRLLSLQIMSEDYKKNADSNAFLKKIQYPSRGVIYDRNDKLLVYNQAAYDITVTLSLADSSQGNCLMTLTLSGQRKQQVTIVTGGNTETGQTTVTTTTISWDTPLIEKGGTG